MATQILHLAARALAALPSSLGSNWLGLLFPLLVFILTQIVTGFVRGWASMKAHWKDNLLIGFAVAGVAWTGLYIWCILTTISTDHTQLNARIRSLRRTGDQQRSNFAQQIEALQTSNQHLQQDCAVKEGINNTLQKQNRDQQGTINGCLSQAMKLLTPEEQKITPLILHSDQTHKTIEWIALINKTIQYPRIVVACNRPVVSADLQMVGGTGSLGGPIRLSQFAWEIQITEPPWSPIHPFYAKLAYSGDIGIGCSFTLR